MNVEMNSLNRVNNPPPKKPNDDTAICRRKTFDRLWCVHKKIDYKNPALQTSLDSIDNF